MTPSSMRAEGARAGALGAGTWVPERQSARVRARHRATVATPQSPVTLAAIGRYRRNATPPHITPPSSLARSTVTRCARWLLRPSTMEAATRRTPTQAQAQAQAQAQVGYQCDQVTEKSVPAASPLGWAFM